MTYYELLGVKPDASREQIRRAYRAAARKLHPDTNTAPDAEVRFREIARAYEELSDAGKRRDYDAALLARERAPERPGTAHYTWTNIASQDSVAMAEEERREKRTEFDEMYDAYFGSSGKRKRSRETS